MVRYLTAVFSTLLIGWSVFPSAAQAQTVCGERKAIVASLEKTYSEAPVSMGRAYQSNAQINNFPGNDSRPENVPVKLGFPM